MIDKNDPRLTAYVLGELDASDLAPVEAALASSEQLRAAVAETQQTVVALTEAFEAQPQLMLNQQQKAALRAAAKHPGNLTAAGDLTTAGGVDDRPVNSSVSRFWIPLAIVASLASVMIGGAVYFLTEANDLNQQIASSELAARGENFGADQQVADENALVVSEPDKTFDASPIEAEADFAHKSMSDRSDHFVPEDSREFDSRVAPSQLVSRAEKNSPDLHLTLDEAQPEKSSLQQLADSKGGLGAAIDRGQLDDRGIGEAPAVARSRIAADELKSNDAPTDPKSLALSDSVASEQLTGRRGASELDQNSEGFFSLIVDNNLSSAAAEIKRAEVQQLVDQSALKWFNLKVSQQASLDNRSRRERVAGRDDQVNRELFTVEIEAVDAQRAVDLLAKQIDPKRKRQLAFEELIGGMNPSSGDRSTGAFNDVHQRRKLVGRKSAIADRSVSPNEAVVVLADNVRAFVDRQGRPDSSAERQVAPESVLDFADGEFDAVPALPAESQGGATGDSLVKDLLAADQAETSSAAVKRLPQLADLDYAQVVLQLKRILKVRNQKLISGSK